jgi:hypothetical protein
MKQRKWTAIRRLRAAGRIAIYSPEEAQGYWRGHMVWVQAEGADDWYIRVTDPRGCYAYDGYWRDSSVRTVDEAVEEAFRGACLLDPARDSV